MNFQESQILALQIIYNYTASSKWSEVKYIRWTTSEVQDLISKELRKLNESL
jgi:hypothetical protein